MTMGGNGVVQCEVFQKPELLERILGCVIPTFAIRPNNNNVPTMGDQRLAPDIFDVGSMRHTMFVLARLRLVSKSWRKVIDDPSSALWLYIAEELHLDPPLPWHLYRYAGGSYQHFCRVRLEELAQQRKHAVHPWGPGAGADWAHNAMVCFIVPPSPQVRMLRKIYNTASTVASLPQQLASSAVTAIKTNLKEWSKPVPPRPPLQLPPAVVDDICESAHSLERLLHSINYSVVKAHGGTADRNRSSQWVRSSYDRYRMFLRLKQAHPKEWLVPTADMEFVWLAHIFRTRCYWNDYSKLSIAPFHSLSIPQDKQNSFLEAARKTAELWREMYGPRFPYLPKGFHLDELAPSRSGLLQFMFMGNVSRRRPLEIMTNHHGFIPVLGASIDLAANDGRNRLLQGLPSLSLSVDECRADLEWFQGLQQGLDEIARRLDFHRHDRRRRDGDPDLDKWLYREHLIPTYERFLHLCRVENDLSRVAPPYVLDLIWHAHQSNPVAYKNDCVYYLGHELHHHPWPNGLGEVTEVAPEFRCAWKRHYGSTMEDDWTKYIPPPEDDEQPGK